MRDNDIWYANESEINAYTISMQPEITAQRVDGINVRYKGLYSDRIYPSCESITSAFEPGFDLPLSQYEVQHNRSYTGARQTIEWSFCGILNMCGIMQEYKYNWRLLNRGRSNRDIPALQYRVCVLLFNLHTCANGGNNISNFFQTRPPSLEEYMSYIN